jgi:hypothetical protein
LRLKHHYVIDPKKNQKNQTFLFTEKKDKCFEKYQ